MEKQHAVTSFPGYLYILIMGTYMQTESRGVYNTHSIKLSKSGETLMGVC